jgi:hypothetical protein
MTEIALILTTEDGTQTRKAFGLTGDLDSLDGIDEAVEQFKRQALPQIEQELLTQAHKRAVEQEKKTVSAW